MGGAPVLGYDIDHRNSALIVNQREATRVRQILEAYQQFGSLLPTIVELQRRGWTTKRWPRKSRSRRLHNDRDFDQEQRPFHRRASVAEGPSSRAPPPDVAARVPRVAMLLALAIRFDKLVRDGHVADYAELARLGHVTRALLTQIVNLLALAADIQEAVLLLRPVEAGKDVLTERAMRDVVADSDWHQQRDAWVRLNQADWPTRGCPRCSLRALRTKSAADSVGEVRFADFARYELLGTANEPKRRFLMSLHPREFAAVGVQMQLALGCSR